MKKLLFSIIFLGTTLTFAQTWSDDVAQIMYDKCTQCHHPAGIAPFSLMTYNDASPIANFIATNISNDKMPPWPPEHSYQSYAHDRTLTSTEKTTVLNWASNGAPEGNSANTPPPPVYPVGSILGNGDLEVQIPTYMSKATAAGDDYVCFALTSNLPTDRVIKSVEIVPGNRQILHHALVFIDPSGNSVTDTVGGDCGSPGSPTANLVMGYTPGSSPMTLPANNPLKLGIDFPANSQVVLNMHYPEGSFGEVDSTKVIFHFYPPGETGVRIVSTASILQNWSFNLPPNQETSVQAIYPSSGSIPANYSLLSVFPHMHLLGKSMSVFGIQPNLDTLKLINIPKWDFEWQDFYFYKNIQKIEAGGILKLEAVFDNTSANPNNPNNPPINVSPGLNTTDEMCLAYMHFLPYQNGDENYNIDSLMNLNTASLSENNSIDAVFSIYPNPFSDELTLQLKQQNEGDILSVFVYDLNGKIIKKVVENYKISSSTTAFHWNGENEEGEKVQQGMYFLSINLNGVLLNQRIIKN